jgi:flagellar L-ring protein precursor FlgH
MKTMSKSASSSTIFSGRSRTIACAFGTALLLGQPTGARADSIWPTGGASSEHGMAADRKAGRPGDILTIVVNESAQAQSSQSKKSSRDSSVADAVQQFLYANSKALTHNGGLPGLQLSGKASYSGGGDVSNTQSVSSRAAVLVTDVLPNGNLVVEGARTVTFSGETQYVVLHGFVRTDDIAPDNTIISSSIADARLEFLSEGDLTSASKKGWISKLYERLRPF